MSCTTTYDFNIYKGSSFTTTFLVKDSNSVAINLSGYSARGVVKFRYTDSTEIFDLSPSVSDPVNGKVTVSGDANLTTGVAPNQYVYDVEIFDSGNYTLKIGKGYFNILPEVTNGS